MVDIHALDELRNAKLNSVIMVADINRMKVINDKYGHLNGDLAIRATADAFKKHSPEGWLFGRYGGDEFIAVGPCTSTENIEKNLRRLSESMSEEFKSLNLNFLLHASVGYTVIEPGDDESIADYIERADKYMYAEKEKYHKYIDSLSEEPGK